MSTADSKSTFWSLILSMVGVTIVVAAVSLLLLYNTAYNERLNELENTTETLAGIMESVAQFDIRHSARTNPKGSWGATMSQIEQGLADSKHVHKTGELLLGFRDGDLVKIMRHSPASGRFEIATRIPLSSSLAEPMMRTLRGESGSGSLVDYRGVTVLAGYAPIPSLGIGMVYKIDLAEVRLPYLRAALWAGLAALLCILAAALSISWFIRPLQRRADENQKQLKIKQQALEESEERLRTVIDGAHDGILVMEVETRRVVFGNSAMCRLLGVTRQELLTLDFESIHPSHTLRDLAPKFESMARGNLNAVHDAPLLRKDGSILHVDISGAPVRFGGRLCNMGVFRDITAEQAQRIAMQQNEARLKEAQRLAKVGSWELDLTTNHLTWSDEIFRMFEVDQTRFGASYEAFLGAIHPDDRERVNKAYTDSLKDRLPYEIVHRLKMADGHIKYVRETCESYFDANGNPLRSVGTVQDITELHKAELELHRHRKRLEELVQERTALLTESEHQLRRAQQIARLGHWSADFQTGELKWSDEIFRIFGRDPATFRPSYENFFACVHPDDRAAVKASEKTSFDTGRHSVDHRIVRPDGSIRWVHEEAQLERGADGKPLRLNGTVQDITERKLDESSLRLAKDDAERANQAKSEFLSRMSHELRTPMNAILGFAQVLEMEKLAPGQIEYVQEIYRAGEHLLELINELLDLSRIEAGKLLSVVQPVDIRRIVEHAVQINQMSAYQRKVVLINKCSAQAVALADPTRLKQILVNLISNAIKYNRVGGRTQIDCHSLDGEKLRLSVTDTGTGIARENAQSLFKPFERLGAEFSATEGTGIGLALSKKLAELMGGELGFDSTLGEGSTFWIDLPAAARNTLPAGTSGSGSTIDSIPGQSVILYIEDNPANLKVVEAMLRNHSSHKLLSATNGEFGIELAKRYRPDVILLDIHLPGMDGYAVLEVLKADADTREIPVIALSADAMPIDIEKGLEAGFTDYLTKPVKMDNLIKSLDRCLMSTVI